MVTPHEEGQYGEDISLFLDTKLKIQDGCKTWCKWTYEGDMDVG